MKTKHYRFFRVVAFLVICMAGAAWLGGCAHSPTPSGTRHKLKVASNRVYLELDTVSGERTECRGRIHGRDTAGDWRVRDFDVVVIPGFTRQVSLWRKDWNRAYESGWHTVTCNMHPQVVRIP